MKTLRLYDLAPSPNNVKVRIALAHKGLAYERIPVDPTNRSKLVELSGQPLTPVLTHGDTVLFDSNAILRYLEANVAREPRLFAPDRDTMKAIEAWELRARGDFGAPISLIFGQFFAAERDAGRIEEANDLLEDCAHELERHLEDKPYLVGQHLSAADCCVAPLLWYGCLSEADAKNLGGPIPAFFREHLRLPEGLPRTRAWVRRVVGPIA